MFLAASSLLVVVSAAYALGPDPAASPAVSLALWALITGLYFLSIYSAISSKRPVAIGTVLFFAAILRLLAWNVQPVYTTDYFRYMWDGKVAESGVNPYKYRADDKALKPLRDRVVFDKANHKNSHTGYGPVAEIFFQFAYRALGDNPARWRALFFIVESFALALVVAIVSLAGAPAGNVVIYAFNPLVLFDLCANMHVDSLLLAAIAAACALALMKKPALSSIALAVAVLIKYFPFFMLPAFISRSTRDLDTPKKIAAIAVSCSIFVLMIAAAFFYYSRGGVDALAGMKYFAANLAVTHWSPFYFLSGPLGFENAKRACGVAVLCVSLCGFSSFGRRDFFLFNIILISSIVLLSPVQRPWYFAWALPFCCVRPVWSMIAISCLSLLTYGIFFSFEYIESIKVWMYSAFYPLLAAELYYCIYKRRKTSAN